MKTVTIKYLASILILLTISTCQKHEWDNPFDPECPKGLWTPANFEAKQIDNRSIKLSWSISNNNISGFKIDRIVGNPDDVTWEIVDWENVATLSKNNIEWVDLEIIIGLEHQYKIYAYAGANQSNSVTTSIIPEYMITFDTK